MMLLSRLLLTRLALVGAVFIPHLFYNTLAMEDPDQHLQIDPTQQLQASIDVIDHILRQIEINNCGGAHAYLSNLIDRNQLDINLVDWHGVFQSINNLCNNYTKEKEESAQAYLMNIKAGLEERKTHFTQILLESQQHTNPLNTEKSHKRTKQFLSPQEENTKPKRQKIVENIEGKLQEPQATPSESPVHQHPTNQDTDESVQNLPYLQGFPNNDQPIMEQKIQRRTKNYQSFQEYLEYMKEHTDEPTILIIGGGLIYDDLVLNSENKFWNIPAKHKNRLNYYPPCTYLVDLDGKTTIGSQEIRSHSDEHFDILGDIDPIFKNKFNIIILEHLFVDSLQEKAFLNIFSMLKEGGQIIFNSPAFNFSEDIDDFDWIIQSSGDYSNNSSDGNSNSEGDVNPRGKSIQNKDVFIGEHMNLVVKVEYKDNNIKIYLPKPESALGSGFLGLEDLKYYVNISLLPGAQSIGEEEITVLIKERLENNPQVFLKPIADIISHWLHKLSFTIAFSFAPPQHWYAQDSKSGYFSITKKSV